MPHFIDDHDIQRLAELAGVHDFEEWRQQHVAAEDRIAELLEGDVDRAWAACLPIWIAQGRVRDLSRAVRVPKYWPSFARRLGDAFAEKFAEQYRFLLGVLSAEPPNSFEYLCAYDLLEPMVEKLAATGEVPDDLFSTAHALPAVIQRELGLDSAEPHTVGETLKRYVRDNSDTEARGKPTE